MDIAAASSTTFVLPEIMDPIERVKRYGIECKSKAIGNGLENHYDGILYKAGTWKKNGEYTQKLVVRNITTSIKKIKYRLPMTRYFSMLFPDVITLSPGISQEIEIVFRPLEYKNYKDSIYFMVVSDGIDPKTGIYHGFHVPVVANIETLIVKCVPGLDMGFCAVNQVSSRTFSLYNEGEIDAPFRWDCPPPFVIHPIEGLIPCGSKIEITVSLLPHDATVLVSQAKCFVGEDVNAIIPEPILTLRLSAISKYPFITLSEDTINFADILTGQTITKEVILYNKSQVTADFTLHRHDSDTDLPSSIGNGTFFQIIPSNGQIDPMSELPIQVTYVPSSIGFYSTERFSFVTPSNHITTLVCSGKSIPSSMICYKEGVNSDDFIEVSSLSANSLNFNDIEVGNQTSRILTLQNQSPIDVLYTIIADPNSVFSFPLSSKSGCLKAMSSLSLPVVFQPQHPCNYYRRYFILVSNSSPIFYDCFGTGFIKAANGRDEQRPAPLRYDHIQAYYNRLVSGYGPLSPQELNDMFDSYIAKQQFSSAYESELFSYFASPSMLAAVPTTSTFSKGWSRVVPKDLPSSYSSPSNPKDFPMTRSGNTTRNLSSIAGEFFINDDNQDLTMIELDKLFIDFGYTDIIRIESNVSSPIKGKTFNNMTFDVCPKKSFQITNKTRGRVTTTFEIPKISIPMNQSNLSKHEIDLLSRPIFSIHPKQVDIASQSSQVFTITFHPFVTNRYYFHEVEVYVCFQNQLTFRMTSDSTVSPPWCLRLNVSGHTLSMGQLLADLKLRGSNIRNNRLLFPTSYINEAIYQSVVIHNNSNIPSTYACRFSSAVKTLGDDLLNAFSVKPSIGIIQGNSFQVICVAFHPPSTSTSMRYMAHLNVFANASSSPCSSLLVEANSSLPCLVLPNIVEISNKFEIYQLTSLSHPKPIHNGNEFNLPQGFQGLLQLNPTSIGLTSTSSLLLYNRSRLPLRYVITLPSPMISILHISSLQGIIQGNDECVIQLTFIPKEVKVYNIKVKVRVYSISGELMNPRSILDGRQFGTIQSPHHLQTLICYVVGQGEQCALTFSPKAIDFRDSLVNTITSHVMMLENISNSDLSYELHYQTIFQSDEYPRVKERVKALESMISESSNGNSLTRNQSHDLFCDKAKGIIPARSRSLVTFSFYPFRSGVYSFDIKALIQSQPHQQDHQQDDVSVQVTCEMQGRASFPKLLIQDIRCHDIDAQLSNVDELWKMMNIQQLNCDLAKPLTLMEVKIFNSASSDLSHLQQYDFNFLPQPHPSGLKVELLLCNDGYLPTNFHIHFPNEQELDLEMWCEDPNHDKTLPTFACFGLINRMSGITPPSSTSKLDDLHRIYKIIEEVKCFDISPMKYYLEPGETRVLTISYQTSLRFSGKHRLPLLCKIDQGREFFINLIGHSLVASNPFIRDVSLVELPNPNPNPNPNHVSVSRQSSLLPSLGSFDEQHKSIALSPEDSLVDEIVLWIPTSSPHPRDSSYLPTIELQSVPIGLTSLEAPKQLIRMYNPTSLAIEYEVDLELLHPLHVVNSKQVIPPKSFIDLEVCFCPKEVKDYIFKLVVKYSKVIDNVIEDSIQSMTSKNLPSSRLSKRSIRSVVSSNRTNIHPIPPSLCFLDFNIKLQAYDPQVHAMEEFHVIKPSLLTNTLIPPMTSLLHVTSPIAKLSIDCIDFSTLPQFSRNNRRILFLHNIHDLHDMEVVVDLSLEHEDVVSIEPLQCRIKPKQSETFIITLNTNSKTFFLDSLVQLQISQVMIRTISTKRIGKQEKLLEKLKNKKMALATIREHESVVTRITESRKQQLEQTLLATNRFGSLPTSFDSHGQLVASSTLRSHSMDEDANLFDSSLDRSLTFNQSEVLPQTASSKSVGISVPSRTTLRSNQWRSLANDESISNYSSSSSRRSGQSYQQEIVIPHERLNLRIKARVLPEEAFNQHVKHDIEMMDGYVLSDLKPFYHSSLINRIDAIAKEDLDGNRDLVPSYRQQEVREMTQFVFEQLFSSLLSTSSTKRWMHRVLQDYESIGRVSVDSKANSVVGSPHFTFNVDMLTQEQSSAVQRKDTTPSNISFVRDCCQDLLGDVVLEVVNEFKTQVNET